ncbi:MAG: hypothetical protein ACTS4T_01000 [Candidatus Hodgkinia cicadicola]
MRWQRSPTQTLSTPIPRLSPLRDSASIGHFEVPRFTLTSVRSKRGPKTLRWTLPLASIRKYERGTIATELPSRKSAPAEV